MTNKKIKKAISLMLSTGLAVTCMATTATTAFADSTTFTGTSNIVVSTEKENRAYELYQIFSGTYSDSTKTLGSIVWGDSVKDFSADVLDALRADNLSDGTANPLKDYFNAKDTDGNYTVKTAAQVAEIVTQTLQMIVIALTHLLQSLLLLSAQRKPIM